MSDEFKPSTPPRKTGYSNEDLHEMLSKLTPKRRKLRNRISSWFRRTSRRVGDAIDDALDVWPDD